MVKFSLRTAILLPGSLPSMHGRDVNQNRSTLWPVKALHKLGAPMYEGCLGLSSDLKKKELYKYQVEICIFKVPKDHFSLPILICVMAG